VLGLAQAAGPLGNLAARQADRPKELAWRAEKALPGEGISRKNSEAAGAPGRKVVSRSYQQFDQKLKPHFHLHLYKPRLLHSIKGQSNETFIQFGILGSSDLKSQPHLFLIFPILSRLWSHLDPFYFTFYFFLF
jgi:hypothetical protein